MSLLNHHLKHNIKNEAEEIEAISSRFQKGFADCTINPLVPKAFQMPVYSQALTEAIQALTILAQAPLEERLKAQQEEIERLRDSIALLQRRISE